ncbi:LOW QUALITY PROTEIN: mind the gap [Aphomia sociella]
MMPSRFFCCGCLLLLFVVIDIVQSTCVLDSDFGFKINCAFKKSGLFRVRNLGGIKAHASLGFSLGDELGFEQSLTNLDPSRRRSVNVRNGVPPNLVGESTVRSAGKQEKRGKQNRIMMRPMAPATRPNQAAMDKLSSLHRRVSSTMQPIIVGSSVESPNVRLTHGVTLAKPVPMGVPLKPLPPKEDTLKVVPISSTRQAFTPLQIPQSKGPGLAYQSEKYPQTLASHNQVSKMVSQMTAIQFAQPQIIKITPAPIIVDTPKLYSMPTTVNPFIPMPVAAPPTQAISIIPGPVFNDYSHTLPSNTPIYQTSFHTNPVSNFVDPVPKQVHELANQYSAYNTKKIDDYNTISGYGDDTTLKFNKEDINAKITEIAKAGNISMEAVEAAIALRQQQLLNKYANFPVPPSTTTTTSTTTTEPPVMFQPQPEPEIVVTSVVQKPKRTNPTSGKVMNAPREYYPVGYEKNFDDHFQSKVELPETTFHCGDQKYFPGLYGDENLGCMVFHVCALTDDGLVMKSFLCPESTLFDQTILKCNWWFYVDCKNTRRLYDTNIPVSKSYQLMKALTFFSSYKKETQEDGRPANPEEEDGIKEAISILENQNGPNSGPQTGTNGLQIVTPAPFVVDERNNRGSESTEQSPVYRANRNYNASRTSGVKRSSPKPKTQDNQSSSEYKLITVNADMNFNNSSEGSVENTSRINTAERKHRRRMTLKNSSGPTTSSTTPIPSTTTTTSKPVETTTSSVEIIKQDIQPIEHFVPPEARQEKLTDQLDTSHVFNSYVYEAENSPPVKRFYRSSAEQNSKEEKEMAMVNNEKVQIIRPTSMLKLVGEYQTPTATIAKLDEAILGSPTRFKKSAITIVTPEVHKPRRKTNDQT